MRTISLLSLIAVTPIFAETADTHPVPVLTDRQTAASAGPGGQIALTVDGLPVIARVAGVLGRWPEIVGAEVLTGADVTTAVAWELAELLPTELVAVM